MADTDPQPPDRGPAAHVSPGAPPTEAGPPAVPPTESTWVTVIGIIGIVYASIGLFGGVCGLGGSAMMSFIPSMAPHGKSMPSTVAMGPWLILSNLAGMVLAIVLLVGAIGLLKRRPWSRGVLMGWAVADIVVTVLGLFASVVMQKAMFAEMARQQHGAPPGTENMMFVGVLFGACFGLIWGWGPPIFTLIWFSRAPIKQEVAGWGGPGA